MLILKAEGFHDQRDGRIGGGQHLRRFFQGRSDAKQENSS